MSDYRTTLFFLITLGVYTTSYTALSDQLIGKNNCQMIDTFQDFIKNVQSSEVVKSHFEHTTATVILSFLYGRDPNPIHTSDSITKLATVVSSERVELVCFLILETRRNKNSSPTPANKEDIDFALIHVFAPDETTNQNSKDQIIYTDPCSRLLRLVLRWAEKNPPYPSWASSPLSKTQVIHFLKTNGMMSVSHEKPDSLMRWAVKHNFPDLVIVLVQAGADPGAFIRQFPSQTPLHEAVDKGLIQITQILIKYLATLKRNSDLSMPDLHGDTPLHLAARKANLYLTRQKQADEQIRRNEQVFMDETGEAFEQILQSIQDLLAYGTEKKDELRNIILECLERLSCAWPRGKVLATSRTDIIEPDRLWPIHTQNSHTGDWQLEYIHKGHVDVALALIAAGVNTTCKNNRREAPDIRELQKLSSRVNCEQES